jgi:XTP/dITP diphosphohydrolase
MQSLCIASNNSHKIQELKELLGDSYDLKSMTEIGCHEEIEETGHTLEENAQIKAKYIFEKYGIPTLSDDSGLEIISLDMRPGVYSARYAGEHGNHQANMDKVLGELEDKTDKSAQFRTVLCLILSENKILTFEGKVEGHIISQKRGTGGFGYDPIFVPTGYDHTFAELSAEIKNTISHRASAIQKLRLFINKF